MDKFDKLLDDLRDADGSGLLWSGGLDSTLLVAAAQRAGCSFTICQFRAFMTKEQMTRSDELIKRFNLEVFSYPFQNRYIIGKGDQVTFVFEYAIGTTVLPNLRDAINGSLCVADIFGTLMTDTPIRLTKWVVGSRADDTHYAVPDSIIPATEWEAEGTTFTAPLYDWTREEVREALALMGIDNAEASDEEDTGNLAACTRCLNGKGEVFCPELKTFIPAVKWDRNTNLAEFQSKYFDR